MFKSTPSSFFKGRQVISISSGSSEEDAGLLGFITARTLTQGSGDEVLPL